MRSASRSRSLANASAAAMRVPRRATGVAAGDLGQLLLDVGRSALATATARGLLLRRRDWRGFVSLTVRLPTVRSARDAPAPRPRRWRASVRPTECRASLSSLRRADRRRRARTRHRAWRLLADRGGAPNSVRSPAPGDRSAIPCAGAPRPPALATRAARAAGSGPLGATRRRPLRGSGSRPRRAGRSGPLGTTRSSALRAASSGPVRSARSGPVVPAGQFWPAPEPVRPDPPDATRTAAATCRCWCPRCAWPAGGPGGCCWRVVCRLPWPSDRRGRGSAKTPPPLRCNTSRRRGRLRNPGDDLLSQGVPPQVPSALAVFTAVFGMGTGVSPPQLPPETL